MSAQCMITGCVLRDRQTGEQWNGDLFRLNEETWLVNTNESSRGVSVARQDNVRKIVWMDDAPLFHRRGVWIFNNSEMGRTWGLNSTAQEYIGEDFGTY